MQRITIRVISNARKNSVEEVAGKLKVYVMAPAVDGKANTAVFEELAVYFGIRKSAIHIVRGEKSRDKVVEIED